MSMEINKKSNFYELRSIDGLLTNWDGIDISMYNAFKVISSKDEEFLKTFREISIKEHLEYLNQKNNITKLN